MFTSTEDSLIGHLVVELPSAIDVHLIESVPQSLYFIPCERGVPNVPPQLRFQNLTLDHAFSVSHHLNNPAKLSRGDHAHCESRADLQHITSVAIAHVVEYRSVSGD